LKLLVVFNPNAQSGRSERKLSDIRDAFEAHSVEAEFVFTRGQGHAASLVADASLDEFEAVVAVGGDGTVFEVLNGLLAHDKNRRIPLGLIPMGTGNAFAREFDLFPSCWREAISQIAAGRVRKVDIGRVKTGDELFYFINILGIGFAVDAGLTARNLKFVGNAAYTLGSLWQVFKLHSYPLVMELDGERFEQDNVLVEVSNSRYTGTSFLIAPGARIDDGLLDVTVLKKLSKIRLLRIFPTIYSGRHVGFEEVETIKARHIRLDAPAGKLMTVDGEFRGRTPVEIECLPRELDLLA
jgi:YegS/Rv2252/BmrU family lipid kinase